MTEPLTEPLGEPTRLTVNGALVEAAIEARLTLADLLRDELGLTGTHLGCEHGVCGACTVLVDGEAVRSCLVLAVQVEGREVRTVEGLADGDGLGPVQEAFWEAHGFQCGFCTPGFVMTTVALLEEKATSAVARAMRASSTASCSPSAA